MDGDIVFVHDLWFPGIEALQYYRDISKIKFKIYGILHAGVYDGHDFTVQNGMRPWGRKFEKMLFQFVDKIFVATQYHKDLIQKMHWRIKSEIKVSGLFFEPTKGKGNKENIVVFPHRLDKEKRPYMFDVLAKSYPDWKFIKARDVCKTKGEYYDLLARSRIAVSFAKQETFGYAMLEAAANGCHCVVPDGLAYKEMPIYQHKYVKSIRPSLEVCMNIKEPPRYDFTQYETKNVLSKMFL